MRASCAERFFYRTSEQTSLSVGVFALAYEPRPALRVGPDDTEAFLSSQFRDHRHERHLRRELELGRIGATWVDLPTRRFAVNPLPPINHWHSLQTTALWPVRPEELRAIRRAFLRGTTGSPLLRGKPSRKRTAEPVSQSEKPVLSARRSQESLRHQRPQRGLPHVDGPLGGPS